MSSLKSFLPALARPLNSNPVALYQRQRMLFDAGVFPVTPGRGPGSGVRLDAHNLSVFLISVLASDTLSNTAEVTDIFLNLSVANDKCRLTQKRKLVDALAAAIASAAVLEKVGDVIVRREAKRADLMAASNEWAESYMDRRFRQPIAGLATSVTLPKRILIMISIAFHKHAKTGD